MNFASPPIALAALVRVALSGYFWTLPLGKFKMNVIILRFYASDPMPKKERFVFQKMRKAWHRSPFSKQVLEYLEDEISSSPTPISLRYDAGKCLPVPSSLNLPDSLARTNLHFPCLSICIANIANIFSKTK